MLSVSHLVFECPPSLAEGQDYLSRRRSVSRINCFETLHAKGWQRGTAVNVYCRLLIDFFFKILPSRIYLSFLVCFFSNSQKNSATKMCYVIPPPVLYNSSLKRPSEAGRVTDFYMRVLSPVLPSDSTQRSSCLMTENQIHVVLKKRYIVPLAFPLSLNRKSVISDDRGRCALDRFTKTFFRNFQNIRAVLCYILIDKRMLEKAFCSNIAPSLSSGNHLFYRVEYMGRGCPCQVVAINFDWSELGA